MLVALSWLRELVPGLADVGAEVLADALTQAGLAVEGIEEVGAVAGVVAGRVLEVRELTGFKKPIRLCQVDVGAERGGSRQIVCGATNVTAGIAVAVALPGTVLPGGFTIAARKTYGELSDGMICSVRELGLGDEHEGIWVLPEGTEIGSDPLAAVRETVLDVHVTPDRGYALSLRGIAREAATALGLPFADPASVPVPPADGQAWPVRVADPDGCDRYVARLVTGVARDAVTPTHLARRLVSSGMRSISAVVDVTNLVMLGLGQPLHAFDADRLTGGIVVRRAAPGERLTTLDGADRELDPADLVIADDSGPIALAGVMGGRATEVTADTTRVLLESAHFEPLGIVRTARRHGLPSEASRRYERGVDPALAAAAAEVACRLLAEVAGGAAQPGVTDVDLRAPRPVLSLPLAAAGRKAGRDYAPEVVRARLVDVGCEVTGSDPLVVTPPSWRGDLVAETELVEEVVRLEGYATIPAVLPRVQPGHGLTRAQRVRRSVGRALAHAGWVEAVTVPFLEPADLDRLGLPADDGRRRATVVANPLADDQSLMRTTLLPGLLRSLARNDGRGLRDAGLSEQGLVFRPTGEPSPAPAVGTSTAPTAEQRAGLDAALPQQPRHVAMVAAGSRWPAGWSTPGRAVTWADAVAAAQVVARAAGAELTVTADRHAPWHPGRCAALHLGQVLVGHAGELHPRVCEAFGVPTGSVAMEVSLDAVLAASDPSPVRVPVVSAYPPVSRDVALVVDRTLPAGRVAGVLRAAAGPLLEGLRLFDRYEGEQVGADRVSLAWRLVLRAPDRTLTDDEANAVRDAAVARAVADLGAEWRG